MKPEYKRKSIRSFVIRAGRITDSQKKAFDGDWVRYGLSLHDGSPDMKSVFEKPQKLNLEIGFGMGDSLLEMVRSYPQENFIGIEVHPPGVGRLINEAAKSEVCNLRVYMADALDVLEDCIDDNSLDRLQLYFPDPWHKKKHNKRRIVQAEFVERVRSKLKVGGVFHLATDWAEYAEHMMEVVSLVDGLNNLAGEYCYSPRPDFRPITKFERRGTRLGHGVWDLLFEKQ